MYQLSQGNTSIIFDKTDDTLSILHWGKRVDVENGQEDSVSAALTKPTAHGGLDVAPRNLVMREHSRGHIGHPALRGHRNGVSVSNSFVLVDLQQQENVVTAKFQDSIAGIEVEITYQLDVSEILFMDACIKNIAEGDYFLDQFLYWLPLTEKANEILDFYGHWTKERQPQRRKIGYGLTSREGFEGRSGHDYTITQIALNEKTGFRNGDAWSLGMAWSGNNIHHVERLIDGQRAIGAGENLLPGEIILKKGQSYKAPRAVASFSNSGLDGITNHHYEWIRSRPHHITKKKARPFTLNMWEALYFNLSEAGIKKIVDRAAEIGVERVILDDGWFGARRHDRAGLGDWIVSKDVFQTDYNLLSSTSMTKELNLVSGLKGKWLIETLICIGHIQIGFCKSRDEFPSRDDGNKFWI